MVQWCVMSSVSLSLSNTHTNAHTPTHTNTQACTHTHTHRYFSNVSHFFIHWPVTNQIWHHCWVIRTTHHFVRATINTFTESIMCLWSGHRRGSQRWTSPLASWQLSQIAFWECEKCESCSGEETSTTTRGLMLLSYHAVLFFHTFYGHSNGQIDQEIVYFFIILF